MAHKVERDGKFVTPVEAKKIDEKKKKEAEAKSEKEAKKEDDKK